MSGPPVVCMLFLYGSNPSRLSDFLQSLYFDMVWSRFFLGSNKVLQVALGRTAADEQKDGIHKASEVIMNPLLIIAATV